MLSIFKTLSWPLILSQRYTCMYHTGRSVTVYLFCEFVQSADYIAQTEDPQNACQSTSTVKAVYSGHLQTSPDYGRCPYLQD